MHTVLMTLPENHLSKQTLHHAPLHCLEYLNAYKEKYIPVTLVFPEIPRQWENFKSFAGSQEGASCDQTTKPFTRSRVQCYCGKTLRVFFKV